jgi:PAB1-binding protein PBP1
LVCPPIFDTHLLSAVIPHHVNDIHNAIHKDKDYKEGKQQAPRNRKAPQHTVRKALFRHGDPLIIDGAESSKSFDPAPTQFIPRRFPVAVTAKPINAMPKP